MAVQTEEHHQGRGAREMPVQAHCVVHRWLSHQQAAARRNLPSPLRSLHHDLQSRCARDSGCELHPRRVLEDVHEGPTTSTSTSAVQESLHQVRAHNSGRPPCRRGDHSGPTRPIHHTHMDELQVWRLLRLVSPTTSQIWWHAESSLSVWCLLVTGCRDVVPILVTGLTCSNPGRARSPCMKTRAGHVELKYTS